MIVDERIYTLMGGKTKEYLALYEEKGLAVQTRILGNMLGYYFTEIGPLNQIVHLWGYESFEERTRRRAELMQAPEWQEYVVLIRPLLQHQENKILIPASFSPQALK
ncbi:MAG: NIPSNAP family protein [Sneathiella sp.]|nr:MAG: NIPSNAP family protein [Sneathiella sp.]